MYAENQGSGTSSAEAPLNLALRLHREDAATLQEKEDAATIQEKEAQADRADTTMENLTSKLVEFLMYVLQENQTTEQAMERDLQKNFEEYRLR